MGGRMLTILRMVMNDQSPPKIKSNPMSWHRHHSQFVRSSKPLTVFSQLLYCQLHSIISKNCELQLSYVQPPTPSLRNTSLVRKQQKQLELPSRNPIVVRSRMEELWNPTMLGI